MTDAEKIESLAALIHAVVQSVKVANGMARGTERAAANRERDAINRIARSWLGRDLTDGEWSDIS